MERFIGAKGLELGARHSLGDQQAMEAMVRFVDEELKHQELFRRLDRMASDCMPPGYTFLPNPDEVAMAVLGKSNWAILALTLDIEIFTQVHYKQSIEPGNGLSPVWKDVFLYHWIEESQYAILDELELRLENHRIDDAQRDRAVDDLIDLVGAVDGIITAQADADTKYFVSNLGRPMEAGQVSRVAELMKKAYRWQYIGSGVSQARFTDVLAEMVTPEQMARIGAALKPLL